MKYHLALGVLLFAAPLVQAEFLQIDLLIHGMD